jgi:hypothetical protein
MKKIIVCMPINWAYVPTLFFISAVKMLSFARNDYEIVMAISNATLIEKMREELAKVAMDNGADYIMWLDADQVYPEDTIVRLVGHLENGKQIVGGMTPHKNDGRPMVWKEGNSFGAGVRDKEIQPKTGLHKVYAMGFGGIAMTADVLNTIHYPRFQMKWDDELKGMIGEDFSFYSRCKTAGIDVWCDTDLVYGHLITYQVSLNDKLYS